jgi:tRNA-Thr(GGU) m(6)t(6)A37 methyltransferase TsaA
MNEIKYEPIGVIHSPFKEPKGTPIQPSVAEGVSGTVEIFQKYEEGLKDLEGFSHIYLIFHLHLSKGFSLKVKPFMDDEMRGVFATRAPARPNPIGLSIVRLIKIEKNVLHIQDLDIVDGTPLLDIKPYVPEFDLRKTEKIGWLGGSVHKLKTTRDDGRFIK